MKGTHRHSCALGPRSKKQSPEESGSEVTAILKGTHGKTGVTVAHCRGRTLEASSRTLEAISRTLEAISGIIISMCSPIGGHFGKIWHHPSGLRSPRANNNLGGNIATPISKQAA